MLQPMGSQRGEHKRAAEQQNARAGASPRPAALPAQLLDPWPAVWRHLNAKPCCCRRGPVPSVTPPRAPGPSK